MKDAQNLAKLLGHLPPKVFRAFMIEEFNATLPELQEKDGNTSVTSPKRNTVAPAHHENSTPMTSAIRHAIKMSAIFQVDSDIFIVIRQFPLL